jgi:nucleoside-diphosphate-sugar epimerase
MTRVLVTGANGFVGAALCELLVEQRIATRAAVRTGNYAKVHPRNMQTTEVGGIHAGTDWSAALAGMTHVVHLAARVHVMREVARDPLADFRSVNTAGTENLARQAATAGVRRFIYVSTIKVNGERTSGRPFCADDDPQPKDAYAQSKLEAELALKEIGHYSGMEAVIVRPPLVYGPGVKGNFLSMLRVIRRGWPLPLASCSNRRSLVGLTNLVSLLEKCVAHPAAAGQVFLAADGEDLSTPELLCRVAHALGRKARVLPFPPAILRMAASIAGHPGVYERLCGSLQIDTGKTRKLLGWEPPLSIDEELVRTAHWFLASNP